LARRFAENLRNRPPTSSIALAWGELGVCRLGLDEADEALLLFRKAEKANRDAGFVHKLSGSTSEHGNVYLHQHDHFTAISYYQQALSLARDIKDPVSIKKWTYNINLAYARIRDAVDHNSPRIA
jgi:tetratricopeptide (TPR) repeat protein